MCKSVFFSKAALQSLEPYYKTCFVVNNTTASDKTMIINETF